MLNMNFKVEALPRHRDSPEQVSTVERTPRAIKLLDPKSTLHLFAIIFQFFERIFQALKPGSV